MAFHLASCALLMAALFCNVLVNAEFDHSAEQYRFYRVQRAAPAAAASKNAAQASVSSPASLQSDKAAAVVQQSFNSDPSDNSYTNSFQTDNGISSQSHGYVSKDGFYIVEGSYTYYSKEGNPITINYVADQNGYQASGDSIPQPDQAIVKAVEYLRSLPPPKEASAPASA